MESEESDIAPIGIEEIIIKRDNLPPGIVIIIKDNGVTYRMDGPVPEEYGGEYG